MATKKKEAGKIRQKSGEALKHLIMIKYEENIIGRFGCPIDRL